MATGNKKLALLYLLEILKTKSDRAHPLRQTDLAAILDSDYGISLERKAISRNLSLLKEAGAEIETTHDGVYFLNREFEDLELRLLIDSIHYSRYISQNHASSLVKRLIAKGSPDFQKRVSSFYAFDAIHHDRTPSLFYHLGLLEEAIQKNRRVAFYHSAYCVDGQQKPVFPEKTVADPMYLVVRRDHYWLIGCKVDPEDQLAALNWRIDRITDLVILDEPRTDLRKTPFAEITLDEYLSAKPELKQGKIERMQFALNEHFLDELVDVFGSSYQIISRSGEDGDELVVSLKANVREAQDFALKMAGCVELLTPNNVRTRLQRDANLLCKTYFDPDVSQEDKVG